MSIIYITCKTTSKDQQKNCRLFARSMVSPWFLVLTERSLRANSVNSEISLDSPLGITLNCLSKWVFSDYKSSIRLEKQWKYCTRFSSKHLKFTQELVESYEQISNSLLAFSKHLKCSNILVEEVGSWFISICLSIICIKSSFYHFAVQAFSHLVAGRKP